MKTRFKLFAVIVFLTPVISGNGYAHWPWDGVRVCTYESSQAGQRMIPDGCGGAFITFQDSRSGNYDIYAQRIDSTGALLWDPEGVVVSSHSSSDNNPRIVSDGAGGIVIVWGWVQLFAQRLDAGGNILWTANGVPIGSIPGTERDARVTSDEMDRTIIVWSVMADGDQDIYAQKLDADGTSLWAAAGVPVCTHASYSWYPDIAHDGEGGAIIIWQDYRPITYNVYAQRIDSLGVAQWTTDGIPVCAQSEYQGKYEIAPDGSGGAVIAWQCRPGPSG
ncbi:MAG: hypothetical protein KOO63_14740, partial [Bacteroidales bacterium]|nr:hypothetical protein [Candidatus Latescibacterota bacterium]